MIIKSSQRFFVSVKWKIFMLRDMKNTKNFFYCSRIVHNRVLRNKRPNKCFLTNIMYKIFWIKFISYKKICKIPCKQIFQKYSNIWERIQFAVTISRLHITKPIVWLPRSVRDGLVTNISMKNILSILSSIINCWQQSRINTDKIQLHFTTQLYFTTLQHNINAQNGWYQHIKSRGI